MLSSELNFILKNALKNVNPIPRLTFKFASKFTLLPMLFSSVQAATFSVTEGEDNGTGLTVGSLSKAILDANNNAGIDLIELQTDVSLTGVMKRLIDSDVTLQSDDMRRTINGNNLFRPVFIKSGRVTIQNIDIIDGRAQGGDSNGGGAGAGMGGAIFVYGGMVKLIDSVISGSSAIGGMRNINGLGRGGAGMYGMPATGGGGLFASAQNEFGGYGGYGEYLSDDQLFARGGSYSGVMSRNGGFGAGGAFNYEYYSTVGGNGGFGGGGGSSDVGYYYACSYGGSGGFGAGGGLGSVGYKCDALPGNNGFGASNRHGAGMGGAIFIRSGNIHIRNTSFNNNIASATSTSSGLGGAIFVVHTLKNLNASQAGMPEKLSTVTACGLGFSQNIATDAAGSINNNNDVFDTANIMLGYDNGTVGDDCPNFDLIFTNGFEG